ncbi:MAG TPA: hypothetical protein VG652_02365 [Gaiellaceae bacterium]|nr:hypothetical protein [Gaiellaceae bacterium]
MRSLRAIGSDESGIALISAVFLIALLGTVAVCLMGLTSLEGARSSGDVRTSNAREAAEAGLNVYTADLTEDTGFFLDYVAAGEARRTYNGVQYPATAGANANANVALNPSWPRSATWTYPADVTSDPGWRTISGTSFQYLLEIFPDPVQANDVRIISIGRPAPSAQTPASDKSSYRAVEADVNALSISDFQMLSAADITYGAGATTNGWVYGTDDDSGNPASISESGSGSWTASANLFTEDVLSSYSGNINLVSPARKYAKNSSPSIRTIISEPITFSALRESPQIAPVGGGTGAIQLNAASSGITLTPASNIPNAWWLKFQSGGTVDVYSCMKASATVNGTLTYYPVEYKQPTCTFVQTYTLSPGGEDIYTTEDVIVSGVVNGQVTVYTAGGGKASAGDGSYAFGDVVIGGNISYLASGSDVLGAVATKNVIIACWEPDNPLSWRAATMSLNGRWESDYDGTLSPDPVCNAANKSAMTFTGSTATFKGGSMGGFNTRTYNYDPTLRYLPPPDYPQIPAALKVMYEREIRSP